MGTCPTVWTDSTHARMHLKIHVCSTALAARPYPACCQLVFPITECRLGDVTLAIKRENTTRNSYIYVIRTFMAVAISGLRFGTHN